MTTDTTITALTTTLLQVPWNGPPPENGIMPPTSREFIVLEIKTKGGLTGVGYLQPLNGGSETPGCLLQGIDRAHGSSAGTRPRSR